MALTVRALAASRILELLGYVDRLCAVGVLALGFGVGLSFEQVPAAPVAAADELGLPLPEVPRRTPFIALSRAVSEVLAADEYAAVTRVGLSGETSVDRQADARTMAGRAADAGADRGYPCWPSTR